MWMEDHILVLLRKLSNMKELEQVHALITKTGLTCNPFLLMKLLICSALPAWGSLEHARSIFNNASPSHQDDQILFNTMIRAYSKSIFPIEAIHLYNDMCQRCVPPDHLTYPFVLRACGRATCSAEQGGSNWMDFGGKGAETHCRIYKLGLDGDVFVQNALMFMYSQCGRVENAQEVFDRMLERTVASWNTMIVAYDRINDFGSANELIRTMPEKNVVSWNTVVARHVRIGDVEAARRVFEAMPEKDAISWNSVIAGYIHAKDYRSALELFDQMQYNRIKPTEITLVSILGACAETGALEMGRQIHWNMKQTGYKIEGYVGNALLDMYAKSGNLRLAREVFDKMRMKHVTCWNTMIVGLAVHGYCDEALELFSRMEKESDGDMMPNRITFLGVLLACSHKGQEKEGKRFFHRMVDEYKIKPDIKHYGCMVDMLSRGGLLDEAYRMIKKMPFMVNPVMWRAILGASRVHGNVEMAEKAFREICELELPNYGDCILLSNIYAEAQRWEDVEILRTRMTDQRVSKQPGFSQIEVK